MMRPVSSIERDVSAKIGARPTARSLGASHSIMPGVESRFGFLAMCEEFDSVMHGVPDVSTA